MKNILLICLATIVFSTLSGTALAQDYEYHPALSDNFSVILGAMRSSNSFKVKADGLDVNADPFGDEIDFNDALGIDKHSTFFNGQIRWKFGKARKWSLFGQ